MTTSSAIGSDFRLAASDSIRFPNHSSGTERYKTIVMYYNRFVYVPVLEIILK